MRLLTIRHAQSTNNAGEGPRVADPALTELGERQAARLAEARPVGEIDLLYVSPMRRTLQTAAAIVAATGLQARVFTGLHEWGGIYDEHDDGHNHLPGLGRDEMQSIIPDLLLPEDVTPEGWWPGELDLSRMEAIVEHSRANAARYLDYLAATYPGDVSVGIVTHGGFGSLLLEAALHVAPHPDYFLRFNQFNTGHALIEISDRERALRWHNRVDHLTDDLITM